MNIAFIGMGTMGTPMALNLLKAGHKVTVHNRTRQKEEAVPGGPPLRRKPPKVPKLSSPALVTHPT